jgi:hypothetical protein
MNYYRIAQLKYKRVVKIAKVLRYLPGIKMIAVCNSLSYNKALPNSDIDLFIITAKGRIWTSRFFSLLMLTLLRLRPPGKDKICLSFFIAENNLDLEPYKICVQDNYLAFWIKQLKPLYIEDNLYKKFVQENNGVYYIPNYKRRIKKAIIKPLINVLVTSLDEKIYKYIQLRIMPPAIKKMACAWDTRVIISDKILKFHVNDRRLYLQDRIFLP